MSRKSHELGSRQIVSYEELASIHRQSLKAADPGFIRSGYSIGSPTVLIVMCRGRTMGRGKAGGHALIVCRCWESAKWVHGNEAAGRDSDVAGSGGEWRIAVCVPRGLESGGWHGSPLNARCEWLCKDSLVATSSLWNAIGRLFSWLRASVALSRSAYTHSSRSDATGSLKAERRACERGRINRRHPNPSLVDLEQICDKGVEVDISIGKVVESELLPIPTSLLVDDLFFGPDVMKKTYI